MGVGGRRKTGRIEARSKERVSEGRRRNRTNGDEREKEREKGKVPFF